MKSCSILIKNAKIIDGTGKAAFDGSIALADDTIVALGAEAENYTAEKIIDASGRYVTPGFIDIHTHVDADLGESIYGILRDRYMSSLVRQGITTAIGGNCGVSTMDMKTSLTYMNEGGLGLNIGMLSSHGYLRTKVVGMEDRKLTPDELDKLKELVRSELEYGAYGLSSGVGYAPGNYADTHEFSELCKVVKEYDGIYASHIRNQDLKVRDSWDEMIEIGRISKAHVHISHCQVIGSVNWGAAKELVDKLDSARKEGINMTSDAFPYEGAGIILVGVLIPNWVQAGGAQQGSENIPMKNRLRDPELLPKIRKEIAELISLRGTADGILFLSSPDMPEIENRFLSDVANEWNMDPVDTIIKIALETNCVECTAFQCCIDDKEIFYKSPYCSVASDANGALYNWLSKTPTQPRNFGCFPKFIELYVKERKTFTIEEAIRKMTSLPANTIGIKDRGVLATGMKADIVILDYDKIHDNCTYTDTIHYPDGIDYVIVNGKIEVEENKQLPVLNGKVILHNK